MRLQDGSGAGVDLRFFLPPPLTPGEFKNKKLIQLFRDIIIKLPADSPQVHECIKYFTSEALDGYLHSSEKKVFNSDIGIEFHHIHSTPGRGLVRYMDVKCLFKAGVQ